MSTYKKLLITFNVLNIIDAISTFLALRTGIGYEANPIMRAVINKSPYLFLAVKALVSVIFTILVWKRKNKTSNTGMWLVVGLYLTVMISHLYFWHMYFKI